MGNIVTALLVLGGAFFAFAAALGVVRLPDVLIRMHASTKAGTLGCGLILVGVATHFGETTVVARSLAAILFLLLTAPVAAHMIGRAAYRTGVPLWKGMVVDQLGRPGGVDGKEAPSSERVEDVATARPAGDDARP